MIRAIVAGFIFRAPEEKLSKADRPYTMATIREGGADKARWVRALLFSDETRKAVAGMAAGDAIAVVGELDCEIYAPDGSPPRISWSIRVDAVLTAQTGARKRTPEPREIQKRQETRNPAPINDDLTF